MVRKNLIVAAMALAALTAGCGAAPGAKSSPTPASPAPTSPAQTVQPVASQPAVAQPATTQPASPAQSPAPTPVKPQQPAVPATPQPVAVPFTSVSKGYYSGHPERGAVLVTDEAGMRSLGIQSTQQVDFQQDALLVVFMGEQRTGGYSVEVTGVRQEGARLTVTVKQTRPGPGAIVTQALTQPYHAVRIPKPPAGTQVTVEWL
jgi:hypothetical protein